MKIFIMRHGEAANIAGNDSLRPLTKQGLLEAKKMGQWLADNHAAMLCVFVSPYLRAQQTCANLLEVLKGQEISNRFTSEILDFITPSGNVAQAHDYIDGLLPFDISPSSEAAGEEQAILLVSHMPFVCYLVDELTGTQNTPIFSTGAIAVIEYDIKQMKGKFVKMISPGNI